MSDGECNPNTDRTAVAVLAKRALNSAVVWAASVALVRILGFFLVTGYALSILPAHEMGLWYVMLNLAGMAMIVDLGFGGAIARFASYFQGGAEDVPSIGLNAGQTCGGAPNLDMLARLVAMSHRLYLLFAAAVVAIMLAVGAIWHGANRTEGIEAVHAAAFVLFALGSGYNMSGLFWHSTLYGINRVKLYNQLFVLGLVLNYALALVGLRIGLGIVALVIGQLAVQAAPRWAARRLVRGLLSPARLSAAPPMDWRNLWPMTWRGGVVVLAAYLCMQNTTLLCSWVLGLDITASYGLSLQVALLLHFFASSWLWVKLPEIGAALARGDKRAVRAICRRRMPLALATFFAGSGLLVLAGPMLLRMIESKTPFLPRPEFVGLLLFAALDLVVGMHSAVLKAGNEAPHTRVYLVSGLLTVPLALALGSVWGAGGILGGAFLAQALGNYWLTPLMCWRRLRESEKPRRPPTEALQP